MKKVSIIVPVYNIEKYLNKCLNSIINQTYKNIEIICINDGSTDNSLQILEEFAYKDKRIKIINQENNGLSSARNNGLNNTTGEYCYFVDSDDWIELDTIEKLLTLITQNDVDCIVHSVKIIAENNDLEKSCTNYQNWFNSFSKPDGVYKIPVDIRKELISATWNKLYKMDIIHKYNCKFPKGLINEDEAFLWEYMVNCNNYYFLNEPFYNYLKRANSITETKNNSIKILDILKIQEIVFEYIKNNNKLKTYKTAISANYTTIVNDLFKILPYKFYEQAFYLIKNYVYKTHNNDITLKLVYIKYKYPNIWFFIRKIFLFLKMKQFKFKNGLLVLDIIQ